MRRFIVQGSSAEVDNSVAFNVVTSFVCLWSQCFDVIVWQVHRNDVGCCVFTVVVVFHDHGYFQEDEHSVNVPYGDPRRRFLSLVEQAARSVVFSGERKMIQEYVGIIQRCDVE